MKILLVDDNRYILESLQQKIDYDSLGFTEVYTAKSMQGAIKVLQEQKIQAMITDIEMPNGTGLELLEWVNQNQPSVVTVFCTSYADFNYAKKAVELHSFDYYLKPVQHQELYEILKRVVSSIREREEEQKKQQLGDYWIKNMEEQKNYFWTDALLMVYNYSEEELEELAVSRHLPYRNEDSFLVGIIRFGADPKKLDGIQHSLRQFLLKNMLDELLLKEQLVLEALLKDRNGFWILVISGGEGRSRQECQRILDSILREVTRALGNQGEILLAEGLLLEDTRGAYLDMEQEYLRREREGRDIGGCEFYEGLGPEPDGEENALPIEKVKAYVDAHYREEIGSEELGALFFYNTAYLTRKFKKVYGKSIGSYLMDKRMEKARELLSGSDLGVSKVAAEVGYDNFSYFSRLFKKKTGYAPKDYRKLFQKHVLESANQR